MRSEPGSSENPTAYWLKAEQASEELRRLAHPSPVNVKTQDTSRISVGFSSRTILRPRIHGNQCK